MTQLLDVLILFGAIFCIAGVATTLLCDIADTAKRNKLR